MHVPLRQFTNSPTVAPAAPIGERPKRSFQCKREFLPHAFALPTGGQVGSRHSPFKRGIVGSSPTRSTNSNNFFCDECRKDYIPVTDVVAGSSPVIRPTMPNVAQWVEHECLFDPCRRDPKFWVNAEKTTSAKKSVTSVPAKRLAVSGKHRWT